MLILAACDEYRSYAYRWASVHSVPKASAHKIMDELNRIKYGLREGELWHMYEVDEYDDAYTIGQFQKFYYTARGLKEKRMYDY